MANDTRHVHLLSQCRNHPNDMELLPFGEGGGVFDTAEQADAEIGRIVEAAPEEGLIEFRGPNILLHQTADALDEHSKEFGGDGRCHKFVIPVWCIGDPEACAARIAGASAFRMMNEMIARMADGESVGGGDPFLGLLDNLLGGILGEHSGEHVHEDGKQMLGFGKPAPQGYATGAANEPVRSFDDDDPFADFDFGGFDEPSDPKRLN